MRTTTTWRTSTTPLTTSGWSSAAKLIGAKRLNTYAQLENDLVTKQAPWAAWNQPTNQFFFSNKVDPKSLVYQPIYEAFPYNMHGAEVGGA